MSVAPPVIQLSGELMYLSPNSHSLLWLWLLSLIFGVVEAKFILRDDACVKFLTSRSEYPKGMESLL
jgi:hypothetical protein